MKMSHLFYFNQFFKKKDNIYLSNDRSIDRFQSILKQTKQTLMNVVETIVDNISFLENS